jgi:hypothetical protein
MDGLSKKIKNYKRKRNGKNDNINKLNKIISLSKIILKFTI